MKSTYLIARTGRTVNKRSPFARSDYGTVAIPHLQVLANWTPKGFVGQMLAKHVAYVPPPAGSTSPLLWGDESVIGERFGGGDWDVTMKVRTLTFRYPHTPDGTAQLFRTSYGPTVRTFEALDKELRPQLAAALVDHWESHQKTEARMTKVDAEYLEVIAVRR